MVYFFIGLLLGLVIGLLVHIILKRSQQDQQNNLVTLFDQLSQSSLQKTQEQFFQLANERFQGQTKQHEQGLEHKKALIDQTLSTVKKEIEHHLKARNALRHDSLAVKHINEIYNDLFERRIEREPPKRRAYCS